MTTFRQIVKKHEKGTQKILRMHRLGAGGVRVALALTHQRDTLLQTIFQHLKSDVRQVAIVALGGYGRKELCFSSDTDVMFLIADEQQRMAATPIVQEFVHRLLDAGLDIGHSFRTINECITLPPEDFESRMSLIEARFICGNIAVFKMYLGHTGED